MALEPDIYSSDHWPWIDVTWKLLVLINWCPRIHGTTVIRDIFRQMVLELNLFSNNVISNIYIFFCYWYVKRFLIWQKLQYTWWTIWKRKPETVKTFRLIFLRQYTVEITAVGYQRNLSLLFPVVTVNKYFCALTIRRWSYL